MSLLHLYSSMRPVLSNQKAQALRQREDQWGQLLKNIDGMYRTSNDDKAIRESIRKQVYKDILEQHMNQQTEQVIQRHHKDREADAKIMEHWRQQGEKRDRIERERKQKLYEATNFNKQKAQKEMLVQTELAPIESAFDVQRSYEMERERRKSYQREMMDAYQRQENERYQKRRSEVEKDRSDSYAKQREAEEYEQRRRREFQRISETHQQNMQVYNHVGTLLEDRERKQAELQKHIIVEGGFQNEMKLLDEYRKQANEQQEKRQHFVKDLQKQLEDDQYRDVATTQLEKTYDKSLLDNTVNMYNYIERQRMAERNRANRQLAGTLVQQLNEKHRRELQEKNMDRKEARMHQSLIYAQGMRPEQLVSPMHIGNIIYEDRMKQLSQVDRNLYQSLIIAGGGRVSSGTPNRRSFHLGQLPPPTEFYRSSSQQRSQQSQRSQPPPMNPEPSALAKQGSHLLQQ